MSTMRTKLLVLAASFAVGLAGFGLYAYLTLDAVKVNGPHYRSVVQGKDLIADILPPPAYIIEAHLVAHMLYMTIEGAANDPKPLFERYTQLNKDYQERHAFWMNDLPEGALKTTFLVDSFQPAERYFQVMDAEFVPAVRAGDRKRAAAGLDRLGRIYAEHRAAIDRVVPMANARNLAKESEVAGLIAARTSGLIALGLFILAVVCLGCLVMARSILGQLGGEPAYAAEMVRRLAGGDLTVNIVATGTNRSSLLAALAEMVTKLRGTIGAVKAASLNLASASSQVSATAQSMAQTASEQAASVEETSASMEQMSGSIAQISENAKMTDTMAGQAAREGAQGDTAVQKTLEAMRRIAERIGVVDEIAYQTNLLALNAAIEAARAGQQGKGFAVVASEVRKLAERSQVAAHEISETARVSVNVAELAGSLLTAIIPAITKTSDLVQEIAAASQEQSVGVTQITQAMSQISKTTQQSAAASEQLAATSQEMNAQADELRGLMEFFAQ